VNGPHDLGGMDGFGPIDAEPENDEPYFHAPWERRAFAVTLAMGALGQWSIDTARHARERQHPVDYLSNSYYENWLAGLETLLVEKGIVTEEELVTGRASGPASNDLVVRKLTHEKVVSTMAKGSPTTLDSNQPPRFSVGDEVRVRLNKTTGHTRAPRYARGRRGTIAMQHGVHIFADKNAHGTRQGQHLYSVRFEAADLWGEAAAERGAVYVDLWDGHLEPA
jgi:nitrile hydratase subunit beta